MNTTPCLLCKGYGWVTLDVPIEDKRFGKAVPCVCRSEEQRQARLRYLHSICRIPSRYVGAETDRPDIALAIRESTRRQQFITVTGPYGTGKTTLLCAAVQQAITQHMLTSVYVLMADLLDHLRRAYEPNSKVNGDEFWDTLLACDVLAIDELDRFKTTEWAEQKLFQFVNERYNRTRGLTLFATNRTVAPGMRDGVISETPGYLESRLLESGNRVIVLEGADLRRRPQRAMEWAA